MNNPENLQGFDELQQQLSRLSTRVAGKFLRQATNAAMTPAVRKARQNVPRGTIAHRTYTGRLVAPGFLSRNIKKRSFLTQDRSKAIVLLGVRREAFYGLAFLERGTEKQAAQPWLVQSFETSQNTVQAKIEQELLKRILRSL